MKQCKGIKINNFEDFSLYMDVSENSGTPKSSILIGFSIINHPFLGTPIFGNTHIIIAHLLGLVTGNITWPQRVDDENILELSPTRESPLEVVGMETYLNNARLGKMVGF